MKSKANSGNRFGRVLCSGLQKGSLFRVTRPYLDFLVKPIFFLSIFLENRRIQFLWSNLRFFNIYTCIYKKKDAHLSETLL